MAVLCGWQALFQNVLTMTGQSRDLNNPSFLYDASGVSSAPCLLAS